MKYKDVYAAHEARMWITTVIIPVIVGAYVLDKSHPEIRQGIQQKFADFKNKCSQEKQSV